LCGCSAELVAAGGYGAEIDLDRAPTAQPDLPAPVIAIGETQERLCWIVPPEFTPALLAIYNEEFALPRIARGACAAVIGTVTESGRYVARYRGDVVMDVPLGFLVDGVRYNRPYTIALPDAEAPELLLERVRALPPASTAAVLCAALAHRDVCSRAAIVERYDAVVRGTTAVPAGYADAGVIVPLPGAPLGVALSVDGNPRYGAIDPQRAAELAVIEAVRNVAAVGATAAGLTDCLNFGDPTDPKALGAFVAAVDGLAHAGRELGVPYVSGNVSLYNQSKAGRAVAPSPIVACVGTIADVARTTTADVKRAGSALVLLGTPHAALGGSVYAEIAGIATPNLALPDYAAIRRELALLGALQDEGLVLAAHDLSDGGVLVAIAEMLFAASRAGALRGARIADPALWAPALPAHVALFAEYGGFVLEVADADAVRAQAIAYGVHAAHIGETLDRAELVVDPAAERIALDVLHEAWAAPLRDFYGDAA
jgi:phosphoribosylformylglycinamidine synthase